MKYRDLYGWALGLHLLAAFTYIYIYYFILFIYLLNLDWRLTRSMSGSLGY